MKTLLLSIIMLFTITANAQDLSQCKSKEQAIDKAATVAKGIGFNLVAANEQKEDNLLVIGFNQDNAKVSKLTFVYKTILQDNGTTNYVFDYVTGGYDTLFKIWQTSFDKEKATKDNKNKKYFDKENKIVYYFAEDEDERWVINYQPLK
jgi:hypothetical protein